jgi:hypothetical protein
MVATLGSGAGAEGTGVFCEESEAFGASAACPKAIPEISNVMSNPRIGASKVAVALVSA